MSLTFSPGAISEDAEAKDIARMIRVSATADYGSGKDLKRVTLDRSIFLHASDGARVLNTEDDSYATDISSSMQGQVMRYKLEKPELTPLTLEILEGDTPRTGGSVTNFSSTTQLFAKLRGSSIIGGTDETRNVSPWFKWIAVCGSAANTLDLDAAPLQTDEALRSYLESNVQSLNSRDAYNYFSESHGEPLGESRFGILYIEAGERKDAEGESFFGMQGDAVFQIEELAKKHHEATAPFPVSQALQRGSYMIVVAHYKENAAEDWKMTAAYVRLSGEVDDDGNGNDTQTTVFEQILDKYREVRGNDPNAAFSPVSAQANDKVIINPATGSSMTYLPGDQTRDAGIVVTQTGNNSGTAGITPQVIVKLTSDDFKHLSPDLYGVTNYALYLDMQIPTSSTTTMAGGYGVVLNGTWNATAPGRALGYAFQFDPGSGGFPMRFLDGTDTSRWEVNFGARPMYFYDAAKHLATNPKLSAPKEISFFSNTTESAVSSENFNLNAGASQDDDIYYRTPFVARSGYQNEINNSFADGRNFGVKVGGAGSTTPFYGMTNDRGVGYSAAVYSPKLMQSWHKYAGTSSIIDMGDNEVELVSDHRVGFRWDRGWGVVTNIWKKRHILKLTVLELTQDVATTWGESHTAGDMFVRAELIQLKPGTSDFYNSQNYVYSRPLWFGKFKGDSWNGNDPSPFKKMGNRMEHVVSGPEPLSGDAQSYRRRNMQVRSWKDSFEGWDFAEENTSTGRYTWKTDLLPNSNSNTPAAGYPGYLSRNEPTNESDILSLGKPVNWDTGAGSNNVWTPPIAVNLNSPGNDYGYNNRSIYQDNNFGQYSDAQYTQRELRSGTYAYNGYYTNRLYGRLSLLRNQGNTNPLYGLYALRGWDYGTSYVSNVTYDSNSSSSKRFLMVTQGLQLPYRNPSYIEANNTITSMTNTRGNFAADRLRVMGLLIWQSQSGTNAFQFNDIWLGEGFAPWEIREILGLASSVTDEKMLELYQQGVGEGFYE